MKTILLIYVAFAAVWLAFFVSQIVIPAIRGTKLFPFFRSDELRTAEAGLVSANENHQTKVTNWEIQRIRDAGPLVAMKPFKNKNKGI